MHSPYVAQKFRISIVYSIVFIIFDSTYITSIILCFLELRLMEGIIDIKLMLVI